MLWCKRNVPKVHLVKDTYKLFIHFKITNLELFINFQNNQLGNSGIRHYLAKYSVILGQWTGASYQPATKGQYHG